MLIWRLSIRQKLSAYFREIKTLDDWALWLEQLDFASDQLALNDHSHTRYAYILIDNTVELMLKTILSNASFWVTNLHDESNDKFPDISKKLANKYQLITPSEKEALCELHKFRNEMSHQGKRLSWLYRDLAITYFRLAANLLDIYSPPLHSYPNTNIYSHRILKYLPSIDDYFRDRDRTIYKQLAVKLTDISDHFKSRLNESLTNLIKEETYNAKQSIREIQHHFSVPLSDIEVVAYSIAYNSKNYNFSCSYMEPVGDFTGDIYSTLAKISEFTDFVYLTFTSTNEVQLLSKFRRSAKGYNYSTPEKVAEKFIKKIEESPSDYNLIQLHKEFRFYKDSTLTAIRELSSDIFHFHNYYYEMYKS